MGDTDYNDLYKYFNGHDLCNCLKVNLSVIFALGNTRYICFFQCAVLNARCSIFAF